MDGDRRVTTDGEKERRLRSLALPDRLYNLVGI